MFDSASVTAWPLDPTGEGPSLTPSAGNFPCGGGHLENFDALALAPVLAAQQTQVNALNSRIQKLERSRGQILKDLTDMLNEAREARQQLYAKPDDADDDEASSSSAVDADAPTGGSEHCSSDRHNSNLNNTSADGFFPPSAASNSNAAAPRLARRANRMKTAPELGTLDRRAQKAAAAAGEASFVPPPGLRPPKAKAKSSSTGSAHQTPSRGAVVPIRTANTSAAAAAATAATAAAAGAASATEQAATTKYAAKQATAAAKAPAPSAPAAAPQAAATTATAQALSSSGRQAIQPDGLVVKEKDLASGIVARVEWRIDNAKNKFKEYIGRHLVSPFFRAAGLKELRLMVAPDCGDIAGRTMREQKIKFDEQLAEGPLRGHVKLKVVTDAEKRLNVHFKTFVGDVSATPTNHDFVEHVVHSSKFTSNWLDQMNGGSLLVGVEILSVESEIE
eukprot:CAMPEP_0206581580 /NCGR_PEP_ID=MMETSP0325_2-20121206/33932_1 /ASSEMBLY_ACC=CAM_ASM_000347 /TAXON_ID=2866 /ORGANISM="Crypthecodinium cohnii, Strain Seligo" /LENGTH=449 /DNA_ID=CAMNT_0054088015 /DNA_START=97 /DNA_END=1446 /DNA_ORIENTATION=-